MFQLNLFFNYFFANEMILYIHMLHSKIIDKIFNEYLCFLIVTINNNNN